QAQVYVVRRGEDGLAVFLRIGGVHLGERLDRLHHRVADQVGEGDLPAPAALQVVVDDDPVVDEQLGRKGADAGGRGHAEAGGHVLCGGGGGPGGRGGGGHVLGGAGGGTAELVHIGVGRRRRCGPLADRCCLPWRLGLYG